MAHEIFSFGLWDLVPWPGLDLGPLYWECRVLVPGPPGKSLDGSFCRNFSWTAVFSNLPWALGVG